MTMPAGGNDRPTDWPVAAPFALSAITEPAVSTAPAVSPVSAAARDTFCGAWLRSHRSTRSKMPKMEKSQMAWKTGTGSRFPTSPA